DACARDLERPPADDRAAHQLDRARQRRAKAHDGAERRGLAGAVAADQVDDLAGADLERDAAQDAAPLHLDHEIANAQHQVRLRLPTTVSMMIGSAKNGPGGRSASTLPSDSAMMRSEYSATRSMSCSTRTMALPCAARAAATSVFMMPCLSAVDTPEVGSSSRITSGSSAKAEATSSSFFSPWDRLCASLPSRPSRPKIAAM